MVKSSSKSGIVMSMFTHLMSCYNCRGTGAPDCVCDDSSFLLGRSWDRRFVRGVRGRASRFSNLRDACGTQRARGAGGSFGSLPTWGFQAQHGE